MGVRNITNPRDPWTGNAWRKRCLRAPYSKCRKRLISDALPYSGLRTFLMTLKLRIAAAGALAGITCFAFSAQAADDLVFTLKNATNSVITEFYASPSGVDEWEEDILGRDVLNPGESVRVTVADGRRACKYDMRFEFTEDSDLDTTTDTQDFCEMDSYTLHE